MKQAGFNSRFLYVFGFLTQYRQAAVPAFFLVLVHESSAFEADQLALLGFVQFFIQRQAPMVTDGFSLAEIFHICVKTVYAIIKVFDFIDFSVAVSLDRQCTIKCAQKNEAWLFSLQESIYV